MVNPQGATTRDQLTAEARSILEHLAVGTREGRVNHMAEVREALEDGVSIDFADHLKFLKKFNYITLNRLEHTLGLSEDGARVVEGHDLDRLTLEIGDYFSHRLRDEPAVVVADADLVDGAPHGRPEGRYVKYEAIGSGGLGTVHRGRHAALGLDVAVKEIKDLFGYFTFLQRGDVSRRLREAVTAQAQLRHPNVVAILDQEVEVAHPYFVMELCEGGSVRGLLDAHPEGLPVERALRTFVQGLHALRAAHRQDLCHLDLKPENLLLDARGNVKVGDFGMARILEVDPGRVASLPQVFLSTSAMAYMAPEQLARTGEPGPQADLYAFGILLYELLTGRVPGRRSPLPSQVREGLDPAVDALFDRMTQDDLDARHPDVDAVLAELHEAFGDRFGGPGDLLLYAESPQHQES